MDRPMYFIECILSAFKDFTLEPKLEQLNKITFQQDIPIQILTKQITYCIHYFMRF